MEIRQLTADDAADVFDLYVAGAASGTLGRDPDEYDIDEVSEAIGQAMRSGFCLGGFEGNVLQGEIHASRMGARRFAHVFSGLTVVVRPDVRGRGVGRVLFEALLRRIDAANPLVLRTELMLQDGNPGAYRLYETLGFVEEGRLMRRVRKGKGDFADDILMARIRPE